MKERERGRNYGTTEPPEEQERNTSRYTTWRHSKL